MNIFEAKKQIKNAMRAYFEKDEYGCFIIPPEAQRPVFLMGPPGIGKTAIMAQIAQELGVGLLSYSMTHHTRQSALGLPLIEKKCYGGTECSVTEYTMSEIIASIYDLMESSGVNEGILFLDEINCVSETLMPTMLQFLQYKTFGKHAVPGGWLVVTAGNPPEYNRSAHEFDIATWDRLKRIDIEPDYEAWREYASQKGVHPAVTSYLDIKKQYFYKLDNTPEGRRFVTARGWDDLSEMIKLYERCEITVDKALTSQYLQDRDIAEDFALYYELFNKYKADYKIAEILSGNAPDDIISRAEAAAFDERLSLLGLMQDAVNADIRSVIELEDTLKELLVLLKEIKAGASVSGKLEEYTAVFEKKKKRGSFSPAAAHRAMEISSFLKAHAESDFSSVKADYDAIVSRMKLSAADAGNKLRAEFLFIEKVWPEGQEMLILITELTSNSDSARFIARYGSEEYARHSDELMFYQRQAQIIKDLEQLDTTLM